MCFHASLVSIFRLVLTHGLGLGGQLKNSFIFAVKPVKYNILKTFFWERRGYPLYIWPFGLSVYYHCYVPSCIQKQWSNCFYLVGWPWRCSFGIIFWSSGCLLAVLPFLEYSRVLTCMVLVGLYHILLLFFSIF